MKYNTGTVTVTNGSPTVTGDGSQDFRTLTGGQLFSVAGSGIAYTISVTPTAANTLTLAANYGGTTLSGQLYTVVQSFTSVFSIPYPDIGDVQTATILKRALMLIDQLLTPATATTAQLASITNAINTKLKMTGARVFNTTTSRPVFAAGATAGSVWVDATGATAHTPV